MIENMLEKSESHRRKIAFLATLVMGVFVFSAWLMIASFNVRQAFNPFDEQDQMLAQDFRSTLPSLRQEETVTTELVKGQDSTQTEKVEQVEEKKPFWKRIFE